MYLASCAQHPSFTSRRPCRYYFPHHNQFVHRYPRIRFQHFPRQHFGWSKWRACAGRWISTYYIFKCSRVSPLHVTALRIRYKRRISCCHAVIRSGLSNNLSHRASAISQPSSSKCLWYPILSTFFPLRLPPIYTFCINTSSVVGDSTCVAPGRHVSTSRRGTLYILRIGTVNNKTDRKRRTKNPTI